MKSVTHYASQEYTRPADEGREDTGDGRVADEACKRHVQGTEVSHVEGFSGPKMAAPMSSRIGCGGLLGGSDIVYLPVNGLNRAVSSGRTVPAGVAARAAGVRRVPADIQPSWFCPPLRFERSSPLDFGEDSRQRTPTVSNKNQVRRSVSSIQFSIKLAVATSLYSSQMACAARSARVRC